MRALNKKISFSLITALYVFMAGSPLYADDTEIYTGNTIGGPGINPNVLFIVDTSGSMTSNVTTTHADYDPTVTYTGSCSTSRYYWSSTGTPPACTTTRYFANTSFYCDDAGDGTTTGSLYTEGFYTGTLGRYNDSRSGNEVWTTLSRSEHTQSVECAQDYGIHGDGGTALYPAHGYNSGPWRTTTANAINWNDVGQGYSLYHGNYLNFLSTAGTTSTQSRLNVVRGVLTSMLNSTSGINASLMRFDDVTTSANDGGYFMFPMQDVADNRASINTTLNTLTAQGYTPLAETLYESMLFFRGDAVNFGNSTSPDTNDAGVMDAGGTIYESPVEFQCQKNFVIMLTDGEPTYDGSADTPLSNLAGFNTLTGGCDFDSGDDCLDEIAHFMHDVDQRPDLQGDQNVITYTIGFGIDQDLLRDTASKGGGGYYTVSDRQGLASTFAQILTDILDINTTFTAPAVTVNAFNRLTHRSELYYALFRPNERPRWPGNLKRYKLEKDATTQKYFIADLNGNRAVDANTGFFSSTSQSWWPDADATGVDGDEVSNGGAAHQLPLNRSVFTYTGATALPADGSGLNLNTAENLLHESNDSSAGGELTTAMLDLSASTTDAERIALIQWARGLDVDDEDSDTITTTEPRYYMGDPLHTKPVLVNYKGTTEADIDITIFMATNEGYLHAIDTETGIEKFAFMPAELLPQLDVLRTNTNTISHQYGMDGVITTWHNDIPRGTDSTKDQLVLNPDGTVQTGEHVYLYVGMRRGGNNYYALDVTDRDNPKLKWLIQGGVTTGFDELGQSWSAAKHIKVIWDGNPRDVIVFGGGYDTLQDSASRPADDTVGRAIFIVDAETGERLWWAGPDENTNDANLKLPNMLNGITADIIPVDADGDGNTDILYTADLGGRIWRIDIDPDNNTANNFATGTVLADVGGVNASTNRRFYNAPSVAWVQKGGISYYTLGIGSGYRSHPLNQDIQDRFYVIRDENIDGPPTDAGGAIAYPATLTEADLFDATSNIIQTGSSTDSETALTALTNSQGWFISLEESDGSFVGEKVMAPALTIQGQVKFTTYTPVATTQVAGCSPNQGRARLYVLDLFDATAVVNFDTSTTGNDRAMELVGSQGGFTGTNEMFTEDGTLTMVGTETVDTGGNNLCKSNPFLCRTRPEFESQCASSPATCDCRQNPQNCMNDMERREWRQLE